MANPQPTQFQKLQPQQSQVDLTKQTPPDSEAVEFWKKYFSNKPKVKFTNFCLSLVKHFNNEYKAPVYFSYDNKLPNFINTIFFITGAVEADDFITLEGLSRFIKQFGPFKESLMKARTSLFDEKGGLFGWFHGAVRTSEAEIFLTSSNESLFLVRMSNSQPDKFTFCYSRAEKVIELVKTPNGEKKEEKFSHKRKNLLIENTAKGFTLAEGNPRYYPTLPALIESIRNEKDLVLVDSKLAQKLDSSSLGIISPLKTELSSSNASHFYDVAPPTHSNMYTSIQLQSIQADQRHNYETYHTQPTSTQTVTSAHDRTLNQTQPHSKSQPFQQTHHGQGNQTTNHHVYSSVATTSPRASNHDSHYGGTNVASMSNYTGIVSQLPHSSLPVSNAMNTPPSTYKGVSNYTGTPILSSGFPPHNAAPKTGLYQGISPEIKDTKHQSDASSLTRIPSQPHLYSQSSLQNASTQTNSPHTVKKPKSNWPLRTFFHAIAMGDLLGTLHFIEHGGNVNSVDEYGLSCVHICCGFNRHNILAAIKSKVQNLIFNLKTIKPITTEYTSLMKYEEGCRYLPYFVQALRNDATPLFVACQNNYKDCVNLLVQWGVDTTEEKKLFPNFF